MKILQPALLLSLLASTLPAADPADARRIEFPDVPGYVTLVTDLHQHTVFSDGSVWPDIRIQEALRDGLDAVSMTEHIEYQPWNSDIPHPDRNRAYEVATGAAKNSALMVIHGSEITRSMPPGHANAIFLQDSNKLLVDSPIEAYREAKKQGAFIFWNHPSWTSQTKDGIARVTEMHEQLFNEGLIDGIEVVNNTTYSDEALQIALDRDLTIMGTSDIHKLIDWQYDVPGGGHRPVTLVFAKERSVESLHEALNERRTAVWFKNLLIGRTEHVLPLITSSVTIESANYPGDTIVAEVAIKNVSDAEFVLRNRSDFNFHDATDLLMLKPHVTTRVKVKTLEREEAFDLKFEVMNVVTAPHQHPTITLNVPVQ